MKRSLRSCACAIALAASLLAQPYGSGTAGQGGLVPELVLGAPYMGNAGFSVTVTNGLGGAYGLLGLSLSRSSLFVGQTEVLIDPSPTALLMAQPFAFSGTPGVPGSGTFSLPISLAFPPTPSLAGIDVHAQAVILGDEAIPGSPAATAGHSFELTLPPLVFVGTSVGGSSDPYWFVDPTTQTVASSGGQGATNNVTAAVFTEGGSNLFVASSITNTISRADLSGPTPVWSSTYTSPVGATYGIGYDKVHRLLFTTTGGSFPTAELIAIDGDPQSTSYGTLVGQTTGLVPSGGIERWALSPSGRYAAALTAFGAPQDSIVIVDTDASSPGFMQVIGGALIPGSGGLSIPWEVRFAPDDSAAWVVLGWQSGELARFDLGSLSFTDFNPTLPGVQNVGANSVPAVSLGTLPHGLCVSHRGDFVIVSGLSGTGGGFVTRVDVFASSPTLISSTPINVPAPFAYASSPTLNADDTELALTSHSNVPPELILIDPQAGIVNGRVPLVGGSNIYTALFR